MTIIFISLASIVVIYFVVALLPWKVCAICSAVSLTWLGLLVTYMMGLHNESIWLGVLMGGSVVGLMYKLDEYFKKQAYSRTWFLKLGIVVFGFLLVYVVVSRQWQALTWLLPLVVIVGSIGLMLMSRKSDKSNVSSSIQDKLDHCCD